MATSEKDNIGIAYTYNEPVVWYEYMVDIAKIAQRSDLINIMVTNGYINHEPLLKLIDYVDAFNIDLKAFNNHFYKELANGSLNPVKNTLLTLKQYNKHIEITFLVVTQMNDNEEDFTNMINWICNEFGPDTVMHISRYFPNYNFHQKPTPLKTLNRWVVN